MLTPAEFNTLLAVTGEPVSLTQAKPPQASYNIRAIVQDMTKAPENIVNAYGLSGKSFQFPASGFAVPPEKFDTVVRANGDRYTLDVVNAELQRGSGAVSYYIAYAKGND